MGKAWIISLLAAGVLIAGAPHVSAHGGIDDGDDGEEGEGGGTVQGGTPLEELYPGYYEFQNRFVSWSGTWARINAMNAGVTTTVPAGQAVTPFDAAPSQP
ncbi:MAG: hypothetical protein KatS3mg060_3164 [Dehalococcoidia bacterium]|nr:MAG: hypothetical protein KatS3mg060_3164 [Dehalococcoidia bacterium]